MYKRKIGDNGVYDMLEKAYHAKDSDALEKAMNYTDFSTDFSDLDSKYIHLLCNLLEVDWHICHESIAFILECSKSPLATETLYKAAEMKFEYLEYDNSIALARKCIWGLWEIGTEDSIDKIRLLTKSNDTEVRELAEYQLRRLDPKLNY